METREAILTRQSIRVYNANEPDDEQIKAILEAAVRSPSGGNAQPWAFISIRNARRLQAIKAVSPGMIGTPTAAIVICLDRKRIGSSGESASMPMVWMSLGAAMQNILLAAHDNGLGACAIGSFHNQSVASLLNLPDDVQPVLIISIGYPLRIPKQSSRRPNQQIAFMEKFETETGAENG
ncbi:MAG: nitroreductase family protein [Anaerolineae bacterium]|nr:nitroreductase family protein [Anaerolineae bacterium]